MLFWNEKLKIYNKTKAEQKKEQEQAEKEAEKLSNKPLTWNDVLTHPPSL